MRVRLFSPKRSINRNTLEAISEVSCSFNLSSWRDIVFDLSKHNVKYNEVFHDGISL